MSEAVELIGRAVERIRIAIEQYKPVAVFGMFSGGHDSLTSTYVASLAPQFTAAVHINTGFGVEKTREFVRDTARSQNWMLLEYKALENTKADNSADPQDYRQIVRQYGFPGAHGHGRMYARLKERQIRRLTRDYKKRFGDKIMLVSGCRSQESERRMRNTLPLQKDGSRIWVNPIHDFSKSDCHAVMKHAGLKRNEVVDLIHKSGECLCGAFAKPGELAELALWFPKEAQMIKDLEAEVVPKFGWGWEGQPPRKPKCPSHPMFDIFQPLCWNCNIAAENQPA